MNFVEKFIAEYEKINTSKKIDCEKQLLEYFDKKRKDEINNKIRQFITQCIKNFLSDLFEFDLVIEKKLCDKDKTKLKKILSNELSEFEFGFKSDKTLNFCCIKFWIEFKNFHYFFD